MKFFQNIQNYDMHVKTMDGVTQQTLLGAVMTIVASIVVLFLFISEVRSYTNPNYITRMQADHSADRDNEAPVRLHFDMDFFNIPCNRISFAQEVVRGQMHLHLENHPDTDIKKDFKSYPESTSGPGCWMHGSLVTDKIAGNFIFKIEPDKETKSRAVSDKAAPGDPVFDMMKHMQLPPIPIMPNLHHRVNSIMFLPVTANADSRDASDITLIRKDLLDRYSTAGMLSNHSVVVAEGTGIHHYGIQVIPAEVKRRDVNPFDREVYQYSVTQRSVDVEFVADGITTLAGTPFSSTFGIVFTYDFYPLKLLVEARSDNFMDFLANLFGIIGGVITVIGLLDRCLLQGSKVVMGKND
jgi:hypothetical protein